MFLVCEGRSLEFYYDQADFYKEFNQLQEENNLPMTHPLRICMFILFVLGPVLPIIGYGVIFWYGFTQESDISKF